MVIGFNNVKEVKNMQNIEQTIIKLAEIEDKLAEIDKIVNIVNFWAKEYDYELMPILKLLNGKMADIKSIIRHCPEDE